MRRIQRTDFERLYDEHAQALYGFLAYRTGDPVLAEDLVADTFERVLRARKPFDPRKSSEKTWLYTIALNRLRDTARTKAAEGRAVARLASNAAAANGNGNGFERAELRHAIMAALAHVNDDEREALALRYGADMSLAEIARLIGKPRSTVEGRLYKGLKRLRAELGGEEAERQVARPTA